MRLSLNLATTSSIVLAYDASSIASIRENKDRRYDNSARTESPKKGATKRTHNQPTGTSLSQTPDQKYESHLQHFRTRAKSHLIHPTKLQTPAPQSPPTVSPAPVLRTFRHHAALPRPSQKLRVPSARTKISAFSCSRRPRIPGPDTEALAFCLAKNLLFFRRRLTLGLV